MAPTLTLNVSPPGGGSYPAATEFGPTPAHPSYQTYSADFTPADGTNRLVPNRGFGDCSFYMLATDNSGEMVFEPGPDAEVIYMTASGSGATPASIRTAEGLGFDPDENWVANNSSTWGRSEANALDWASFTWNVWREVTVTTPLAGHWIMLERGYDYAGQIWNEERQNGPSPLHPAVIGAWGTGTPPNLTTRIVWSQEVETEYRENIAFSEIEMIPLSLVMRQPKNLMWNKVTMAGPYDLNSSIDLAVISDIQGTNDNRGSGLAFHKTLFNKVSLLDAPNGDWLPGGNPVRGSGLFVNSVDGIAIDSCVFDECGWDRSFVQLTSDPNTYDASAGHPPNVFNHDAYIQKDCGVVYVRDSMFSRGSLSGLQARCGGFFMGNVWADNNIDHQVFHGGSEGTSDNPGFNGNWATYQTKLGDVHTLGSIKDGDAMDQSNAAGWNEGLSGETLGAEDWVAIDLMAANAADPLDAADVSAKAAVSNIQNMQRGYAFFRDAVIANWMDTPDEGTSGLSAGDIQECTIGQFVDDQQSVTAGTNTTTTGLDWIVAQSDPWDYVPQIQAWYATRLGKTTFTRSTPAFVSFTPNRAADGYIWANYTNWSSDDIPGVQVAEDSVNIAAWEVISFEKNCRLANFTMDSGGILRVRAGKTRVTTLQGTGSIHVDGAGQFWCRGTSGVGVRSFFVGSGSMGCGRLGFESGTSSGVNITLTENRFAPELVICSGATVNIDSGRTLTIDGADLRAGFDGTDAGTATLNISGTLAFVAVGGAIGTIQEFRSGFFGVAAGGQPNATSVASTVVLEAGSTVTVDTTGLASGTYTLIEVDSLTDNGATLTATSGTVAVNGNRLEVTVP